MAFCFSTSQPAHSWPVWNYDGNRNSQEDWGKIKPEFAKCEIGTQQSPVQITETKPSFRPPLKLKYKRTKAKLRFTDYTISIEPEAGNTLYDHQHVYRLVSIRFHTPSEHTVRGKFFMTEIQLIHQDKENNPLILSVFANMGEALTGFDDILAILPDEVSDKTYDVVIDPSIFLPKQQAYYAYTGSITYPPCSEGVEWRIFTTPISISIEQLDTLSKLLRRNARLTQPLYMRTVEETRR